ncbi:MAG: translation initiation factor IF-2 [Bacilli bacterium]|nr:translation initiation factor IF-2 [Bacilli bacterium]
MKVKEILEILGVAAEELLQKLDNVGVEADLETDIKPEIIKKLSKVYKVDIKPAKKKPVEKIAEPVEEVTPIVTPVITEKPVEPKLGVKKPALEPITPAEEKKVEVAAKTTVSTPVEVETKVKPLEHIGASVELNHVYDQYEEFVEDKNPYNRLKNVKKNKVKTTQNRQANLPKEKQKDERILYYIEGMTVAKIADGLSVGIGDVVRKLVTLGYMTSATEVLERDTIELVALEFGYELKNRLETDITKFEFIDFADDEASLVERPPIVTIMGHVDHGKTTLLDTIRNAKVVASEAGGITQHIGAYQVRKNGKLITFIDTPGHAAFTEMRARGAGVTDIVILVVAADDGVMPQTIEAIEHAQAAKVPIIVAINKMDKKTANPERIKQELVQYDLLAEEWGGKTIFVPLSALTGKGVEELLEMILLVSEIEQYKANPNRLGYGSVIEARIDKGRGVVATLLVKNGSVKIGDPIVVGSTYGKIRAMQDETLGKLKSASPSKAVEVTGLLEVPNAGDRFMVFEDEKTARLVAEQRMIRTYQETHAARGVKSLSSMFEAMDEGVKELNLIIKGDVQGSIEALKGSLEKVNVEGAKIEIVRSAVGTITDTDISLAVASSAIVIGFNIRPNAKIVEEAKAKGIEVRLYNVIYKVLEDIEAAMTGLLDPVFEEKVIGQAEVRDIFKASKIGTIAGCYVTSGEIRRSCDIRLIRDSIVVYSGALGSLKRVKDDVKEVRTGFECGLTIENFNDIKVGDVVEAYVMEKVK